jgi:hypothetical protein
MINLCLNKDSFDKEIDVSSNWNDYNCMGYALGDKRWLGIRKWDDLKAVVKVLVKHYALQVVTKAEMVSGQEYVAYRYGHGDFHYMKRDADGLWTHKAGSSSIASIEEYEVFDTEWDGGYNGYDSDILLFQVINSVKTTWKERLLGWL